MEIAEYFQTWSSPWTSVSSHMDLATIDFPVTRINLAFAKPDLQYSTGQHTFTGTGIEFSSDFDTVKGAIDILQSRGIEVLIAVGGASYSFDSYNATTVSLLVNDLGVDGVDLDWEPFNGKADDWKLGYIIKDYRDALGNKTLSLTGWSTGAYTPDGSTYQGMNIKGLQESGSLLDFVNIMTYDAGTSYNPIDALYAYRKYFSGPINLGFEIGTQAWGGAILSKQDVENWTWAALQEDSRNGVFVWSFQKDGDLTSQAVVQLAYEEYLKNLVTTITATKTMQEETVVVTTTLIQDPVVTGTPLPELTPIVTVTPDPIWISTPTATVWEVVTETVVETPWVTASPVFQPVTLNCVCS